MIQEGKVWAPDPVHGFALGRIVDIGAQNVTIETIKPPKQSIQVPFDGTFPAQEDDNRDVDDNCALMFLNEATLLNNVKIRYTKDKIYTYVANILIAVNPYIELPNLYSSATIKSYQGRSLGTLPPHVFAIADKAFRDMKSMKESQSVIVSGESGSGKTESTKYVLRYLCESYGGGGGGLKTATGLGQIEQLILDANPLLEAFGNAKTVRNNNSSRFGKFIEIHFDHKFSVAGGHISHYLLEKSRICGQICAGERNYHIFYQLIAGSPPKLYSQLSLMPPDQFNYLSKGCCQFFVGKKTMGQLDQNRIPMQQAKRGALSDPIVDDVKDFAATDRALVHFGVSDADRLSIYRVVAGVLHLGNVLFEENPDDNRGGCRIKQSSLGSLQTAASLFGLDPDELRQSLLSRLMQTAKGGHKGTVYLVPLKVHEASNARDALAKAIYSNLFDYLITMIVNKAIPSEIGSGTQVGQRPGAPTTSGHYIGCLDIAGFEYFEKNSFEQLCINYCNEKLQQFFNDRILNEEQLLYEREGLKVAKITFSDNSDCIELIEAKCTGILDLLDEESKLPKPTAAHFTQQLHTVRKDHFRLAVPRKSKLKDHRELRDDEGFLVRHFAGAVCYETAEFLEKNNDALHASLESIMFDAENQLLVRVFDHHSNQGQSAANNNNHSSPLRTSNHHQPSGGKLNFVSVGSKFRTQLNQLMAKLKSTGTHFIRCVKPNVQMAPGMFEGGTVLSQLRCSGMTSVLSLMEEGYPSRTSFNDLYATYKSYLPPKLARLDPRLFCRALFKALGLNETDFKFGQTKVFFRPGKFAEFDQLLKSDPQHLAVLISKVAKWLIISRWKKVQYTVLSVIKVKNRIILRRQRIIAMQSRIRGYIARRNHIPRINGLVQLKKLELNCAQVETLINQIKPSSKPAVAQATQLQRAQLTKLRQLIGDSVCKIKANQLKDEPAIKALINQLSDMINAQVSDLKKLIAEQQRLRALEEQLELEKRKREEEERKQKEEEEVRRKKAELESRRIKEEQLAKRRQSDLIAFDSPEELERQRQQQLEIERRLEQEKRDHELALRLAQETQSGLVINDDSGSFGGGGGGAAGLMRRSNQTKKGYELSSWKYSELRDTINTSCDLDLLEACREEFHRRLKVYHAWKSKNANKSKMGGGGGGGPPGSEEQRAPQSVMEHVDLNQFLENSHKPQSQPSSQVNGSNRSEQRYFRVPFVRPSAASGQRGWWLAHFDGQWIARQLELHPEKDPILLIAGQDDMQMCELSLDETRLTSKRGAEILESEFEAEWQRCGGKPYVSVRDRNRPK